MKQALRTPHGHDLDALRESLTLSPAERIRRNAEWVRLVEVLRGGLRRTDGPRQQLDQLRALKKLRSGC